MSGEARGLAVVLSWLRRMVPSSWMVAPGALVGEWGGTTEPDARSPNCFCFSNVAPGSSKMRRWAATGEPPTIPPRACRGSTAAASSASTLNAAPSTAVVCAAEAKARNASGGRCCAGTSGLMRATHTPTPRCRARAAISASSAFSSPAPPPAASRSGTTGDPASASVVNPGMRPLSAASRSAAADICARSTSPGSADTRLMACAAAVARYGGRLALKTYPDPISRWYATTPVSPAQNPPTLAPAPSRDATMTSTLPVSTPKCSVSPRPEAPIAPKEQLSSRMRRAWCVSLSATSSGSGARRPVPRKQASVMSQRRRPGRARRAEVTPSSASRFANTRAQSSASQWLYQRTSILANRRPARIPWPTPRSTTATSDRCPIAGITEDTVHAPKEYSTASWQPRNSAMVRSTSTCGGKVP
mmetsp:Transcript_15225/g.37440  ORF Transcript_15225/g.37440 Transcript_15225/m.37440 type:complete len:417 (+) Transcript_15225:622-1872(+)